jgi:pimeloyl-ACP methyl ester carboxylesterase
MSNTVDYAFLHGGGQGSWIWDETIAALRLQSDGARCLALDVPGCGFKRDRDTNALTMDDIVAELLDDLVAAGMRDIVLIGHSQAGSLIPLLAEKRPDLFSRLVYVTCSSPLAGQTVIQMMGSGTHGSHPDEVGWPFDRNVQDARERYPLMFCNDMTNIEAATLLAKLGKDHWPGVTYAATEWRYDHLDRTPATYVVCLRDGVLPVVWQERFAARFRVQRLVRIDAGHQVMTSRPHGLAEILHQETTLKLVSDGSDLLRQGMDSE